MGKKRYMTFNPTKTEQLHFTRRKSHIKIEINMDSKQIEIVRSHKHQGVIIQREISRRAHRRLDIMRSFNEVLDKKSLEKLYLSFIRPILEFSSKV